MTLLAACADHVSRGPTRAFVKPAEPGKPASQGVKLVRVADAPLEGRLRGCYGRFGWAAAAGRIPAPMAAAMVRASRVAGRRGHAGPARWRWPVGYSIDLAVTWAVARSAWAARSHSMVSKLNSPSACG